MEAHHDPIVYEHNGSILSLVVLLAGLLGLLSLDREARQEPSNASLVIGVFRVLAGTDAFSQASTSLEDCKVPQDAQAGPAVVCLGAVAGPDVHGQPDGLLGNKVGVTRPRPKTTDNEAPLEILSTVLVLVGLRNARAGLVLLLGSLEVPLLTIGEELDEDEEEYGARKRHIGQTECLGTLVIRGDNKDVGWGRDEKEEQGLGQCDESKVEDGENKSVAHLGAHDLPAVVLGTDGVSSFAPVVESQADLLSGVYR